MAKKRARAFREVFAKLLDMPIDYEAACEISGIFSKLPADMKNDEAIAMAMIYKAMRGDTAAAKYIAELVADSAPPVSDVKVTVKRFLKLRQRAPQYELAASLVFHGVQQRVYHLPHAFAPACRPAEKYLGSALPSAQGTP